MNRVIEKFSELKTEHLTENWVQKVWTLNGFTSFVQFPAEFEVYLEEINVCSALNDFNEALRDWFRSSGLSLNDILESDSSSADSSNASEQHMNWQSLIDEGIDYKSIICILGNLILRFIDESSNPTYFKEALFSIRLYSYMIAIPGSHICQIFNSTLYSHVVAVVRICCEQIDNTGVSRNKSVKRKKNEIDDDLDVGDSENSQLNYDKTELMSLASDFLANLKLIFENEKLKLDESSLNLTIQILMMITRLEKNSPSLLANNMNNYRKESIPHLASKSFMILLRLAVMLHSNPAQSVKLIMKSILPVFLINESGSLGLGPKDGTVVRTNFTYFLKILLDRLGESAYDALNILVQRICVSVPDRAEMRLKASHIVLDILRVSPPDLQAEEIYSIVFMSHMSETKIRLFTLEIISKLLLEVDAISFTQLPQKYAAVTNDEFLLAVIVYRCQDMTTSISTKALSYLDQIISSANTNRRAKKLVDKIFVEPYVEAEDPEKVPDYRREIFDTQQFLSNEEQFLDDCELNPLPGVKVILDMLVYFSQEDKVFVKKSARQTLSSIFLYNRIWIKMDLLQVFLVGCDDSSVLVRKTMSQILTDLLIMYPDHKDLIICWVEGVAPMIADEEAKAQEKVIEHFCRIILNNIMYHAHTTSIVSRLPWLVMKEILSQGKRSYLHYAIGKWVQTNAVKSKTVPMIYSHIDQEYNDVAWCLLVSFSQFMNLPNVNIIYEYFQRILPDLDASQHSQIVLETLYYVCANMSVEDRDSLFLQLEKGLIECSMPLKLIARARDICEQILTLRAGKKANVHNLIIEWSEPKIKGYFQMIEVQIGKDSPPEIQNTELLIKHIFMVGEFALASPKSVSKSDIKLLQNLLLSPRKRDADAWKGRVSNAVKAITILTLVKLILQKEDTANGIMPIFREILSSNSVDATIQVNTIIGMCDLCSRYTTLVERYFTYICKCFNSPHEMVRKTVLICVMKRIREEYVKLRPYILYPMLTMILDKSDEIKRILATFITIDLRKGNHQLETFYPGLFFFLNNSKAHSSTTKISEDLRVTFSFTDNPEKRNYIYTYVLDKLADTPRRLLICKKIVNDIMASVANEAIKLDEKVENVLTDAFNILIDNERKISEAITKTKKGNTEEADDIEEMSEPNRAPTKSSQGVVNVTEALRLSEASEIIPVIIKLRILLKQNKSKCLTHLMTYMCELMRNFKNEITDLLGGEGDLKAEIEYTLRQMEQEEERKRQEAIEAVEQADANEVRVEEEANAIPVITTSPEEICEQLQNLIVQLSRCDGNEEPGNSTQSATKLSRLSEAAETSNRNSPGPKSSRSSVPSSPRPKSTIASPSHSKSPTPKRGSIPPPSPRRESVPPSPRRGSVPQSPLIGSVPPSPRAKSPPPPLPKQKLKPDQRVAGTKRKKTKDNSERDEEARHMPLTTSTPIVPRPVKKAPTPEPEDWEMEEEGEASMNLGIEEAPTTEVEGVEQFSSDED